MSWEPKSDRWAHVEVVCDRDKSTFSGVMGMEARVEWVETG